MAGASLTICADLLGQRHAPDQVGTRSSTARAGSPAGIAAFELSPQVPPDAGDTPRDTAPADRARSPLTSA